MALMATALLPGCGPELLTTLSVQPDHTVWAKPTLEEAAAEIEDCNKDLSKCACPVLANVMMPDYDIMRQQVRNIERSQPTP